MQIVPLRFCHVDTKRSILWPSKYAKIRFWPGLRPGPCRGAHDAPPDPLVCWGGDTPLHTSLHLAPTHLRRSSCVPPEVKPDLRLCNHTAVTEIQYGFSFKYAFSVTGISRPSMRSMAMRRRRAKRQYSLRERIRISLETGYSSLRCWPRTQMPCPISSSTVRALPRR